jgi:hypothetical protein
MNAYELGKAKERLRHKTNVVLAGRIETASLRLGYLLLKGSSH